MLTFSLQSGSNGNCIYVEAGDVRLLFDAGISGNLAAKRMSQYGRNMRSCTALLISHDHIDHVRCAGIYHRKFGLPLYMTRATQRATWCDLGRLNEVRYFQSGDSIHIGRVTVHTIRTPHDAADGVAFVVEFEGKRLAILTDLGHPFAALQGLLESVDAAYLEANYEPDMLENGPYPEHLKARIRGDGGHLSNHESARLIRACAKRPKWVAVAHLSEDNNRPEHAIGAQHTAVGRDYPVYHASRSDCSQLLSI